MGRGGGVRLHSATRPASALAAIGAGAQPPPPPPPPPSQVGPRLELEIVKVEEGLCDGRVLFHKYQQRSAAQAAEQQQDWDERAAVREERRKQQVGGRQKGWGVGTAESGSCKRLLLHAVPHCGSLADIAVRHCCQPCSLPAALLCACRRRTCGASRQS